MLIADLVASREIPRWLTVGRAFYTCAIHQFRFHAVSDVFAIFAERIDIVSRR